MSSGLSPGEGGGRAGDLRPSRLAPGSTRRPQRRRLCPESVCEIGRGQIKVFRCGLCPRSPRAGWLCPQLHNVLEQLEGPHDVVVLGRDEGEGENG